MKIYLLPLIFSLCTFLLSFSQNAFEKEIQTKLILAEGGDRIEIPEGTHSISKSLSLEEKSDVVIEGLGMDKSILSYA